MSVASSDEVKNDTPAVACPFWRDARTKNNNVGEGIRRKLRSLVPDIGSQGYRLGAIGSKNLKKSFLVWEITPSSPIPVKIAYQRREPIECG